MERICRGCLSKVEDPASLLHYNEKNRRLFFYSTGLLLKRADVMTFQLCQECYFNMMSACKFKKLCRTSDKRLKNYISLKNAGDADDLSNYLKHNDDSSLFRFPLMCGYSTPAQKARDDDNESTCTSIRNFMKEILPSDDIPDTEACIIKEVIEEEADMLDDSLDSNWLQDDVDFNDSRLDFSPFCTPRNVSNGFTTPQRLKDLTDQKTLEGAPKTHLYTNFNQLLAKTQSNKENIGAKQNDLVKKDAAELGNEEDYIAVKNLLDQELSTDNKISSAGSNTTENNEMSELLNNKDFLKNESSVPSAILDFIETKDHNKIVKKPAEPRFGKYCKEIKAVVENDEVNIISTGEGKHDYTIDKNLEDALRNEENKEFPLDNILLTPVRRTPTRPITPLTPTINNILFGETLNTSHFDKHDDVRDETEDFLAEFLKPQDPKPIFEDHEDLEEEIEIQYDLDNCLCVTCDTEFTQERFLKIHLVKKHKLKFENKKRKCVQNNIQYDMDAFSCFTCKRQFTKKHALKVHLGRIHNLNFEAEREIDRQSKIVNTEQAKICDLCSKPIKGYGNLVKHIKRCQRKKLEDGQQFLCEICSQNFKRSWELTRHMRIHLHKTKDKTRDKQIKSYVCPTCGALFKYPNHRERHIKNTHGIADKKFACTMCEKSFLYKAELTIHMRLHLGEKPFMCTHCDYRTYRRDILNRHIQSKHIAGERFKCNLCNRTFKTERTLLVHKTTSKRCFKEQFEEQECRVTETKVKIRSEDVPEFMESLVIEGHKEDDYKITDLMSIPTVDENSMDSMPDDSSVTNLQEEIGEIISTSAMDV